MLNGATPWPRAEAEQYRAQGYWRGETFGQLLDRSCELHSDRVAVVQDDGRRWTYGELRQRANSLARSLRAAGLRPGQRAVFQLPNSLEFASVLYASFKVGLIPVMALPAHRRAEIEHLCRTSEASLYVGPSRFQGFDYLGMARGVRSRVASVQHLLVAGDSDGELDIEMLSTADIPGAHDEVSVDPSEVVLFLLSGGTTGLPKLIPRTHDDYAYNVRACCAASQLDQAAIQLVVLPAGHNGPLGCPGLLGSLLTGGRAVLTNEGSPDAAFALMSREHVTIATVVPPLALVWARYAEVCGGVPTLCVLQVGGAKLPADAARRVRDALRCELQQWYGMSEGILCHTRLDDGIDQITATQGRPLSDADQVRVVDSAGVARPIGSVGLLEVKGPTVFRGYYKAPEQNAQVFCDDGFFRTGDLAAMRADGYLVMYGRAGDTINRGGEKVSATEVEEHLLAFPGIASVAVVGVPDAGLGERAFAFVVAADARQALTLSGVRKWLRERGLAEYKLPDRLECMDTLPRTAVGKVDTQALRARGVSLLQKGSEVHARREDDASP